MVFAMLLAALAAAVPQPAAAQSNPVPVQTFYVPFPEDQLLLGLQGITGTTVPTNPMTTYVSIAAIADGTIVYFDQWENGYDADIANPGNLYSVGNPGGTQIWGDGNTANGAPPGIASDIIDAGTVIILNNQLNSGTLQSVIDFDGRDKIAATKNVAVTRTGWASGSNTLLAGAVEVYDTLNWGTDFRAPVGENIPDGTDFQMFEYTGLAILAGAGGATISVDANADGDYLDANDVNNVIIAEGVSRFVNGGVNPGARVVSNNPVQVDILTGDRGSTYESRDSALLPIAYWSSNYYTPVSTTSTYGTTVWLYNPGTISISVTYERRVSGVLTTTVLTVPGGPAGGYLKQVLPENTPARFYTSSTPFYAFSTTDSTSSSSPYGGNQSYDWGFSLVPQGSLTPQLLIGLGIGRDPTSGTNLNENGNPVWVTPIGNSNTAVTVYIDYDADPTTGALTDPNGNKYDTSVSLRELEQAKIYDPGDRNQTGMLVYVLTSGVKLAGAWGQDPLAASAGAPGLDVGTSVPPCPLFSAGKNGTLYADNDHDGFITPGDELEYTIVINNISRAPVPDVILQDNLPVNTNYVLNSTYNGRTQIPDNGATAFPLDEGGVNIGTIPVGGSLTVYFRVIIVNPVPAGTTQIKNTGSATAVGITVPFEDITPLGGIGDFVWNDANGNGIQDAGETGIAGVVVNLYASDGTTLIATATTDTNGYYHFTGLQSGNYIVEFIKPTDYTASPQNQGADDALDSDADAATGRTATFTWNAGQTNTTIDAGFWKPTPLIDIQKTPDSQTVIYGQTVTFTIVVTNTGNVSLTNVAVTDPNAPNCAKTIGSLAVGESQTYTCSLENVTSSFTNTANVSGVYGSTTVTDNDGAIVVVDILPDISVVKSANPTSLPETGGNVNFTYTVINHSSEAATITALSDDKFGLLVGDADCTVGTVLAGGASCSFDATFAIPAGDFPGSHTDTFTAKATDPEGHEDIATDGETVTYTDVLPDISVTKTGNPTSVPETGGNVTFTYVVTNNSAEAAEISVLSDDKFGPLAGDDDCKVGTLLAGGASCSFEATFTIPAGNVPGSHVNVFTVTVTDGDGNTDTATDGETITYTDVLPDISVTKTGNPTLVPETGGSVTFTYVVTNNSTEAAEITVLSDDKFGPLAGDDDCKVGTLLAGGASCSFETVFAIPAGNVPGSHVDVFTATVTDGDGNTDTATDNEIVTYINVPPEIAVTKTANPSSLPETGGDVTFTFLVENKGSVDVTLTSLDDNVFGDLNGKGDCVTGGLIPVGGSYSCSLKVFLSSDNRVNHLNTVMAVGTDRDGTTDTATDDETVTFTNVPPTVELTKTAIPLELTEPGGVFNFTLSIHNTSPEAVTITALGDTNLLSADCLGLIGDSLPPDGTVTCTYTVTHTEAGSYLNTASVTVTDNDGSSASATADATVTVTNVNPTVKLTKSATPTTLAEPGGDFTFTLSIHNTSVESVTITTLTDTNALSVECQALLGTSIPAGGTVSCTYIVHHSETGNYPNRASVTVKDNENNTASDIADATVTVTNIPPTVLLDKSVDVEFLDEPGGDFTFTLTIKNTSGEEVTITALTDSQSSDAIDFSACAALIGTKLAAGASTTCTYIVTHTDVAPGGSSYENSASVTVKDNEDSSASATDSQMVWVDDVLPTVLLEKLVDVTTLPDPGGDFHFTLKITNTCDEPVVITQLWDNQMTDPDLVAYLGTFLGTELAPGAFIEIPYVINHTDAMTYSNTATVWVQDNEENTATDEASQMVEVTDVLPTVTLVKTVTPATLPEPGGEFTFTLTITNNSPETVWITELTDTNAEILSDECLLLVSDNAPYTDYGTIPAGGSVSCAYTVTHTEVYSYDNTASVTVMDNELNEDSDSGSQTVTVTDVKPTVDLTKAVDSNGTFNVGDTATFTLAIKNTSPEPVTITALTDTNTLSAECLALVGQPLAVGESKSCTYTVVHTTAGTYPNTASVTVKDNENNSASNTAKQSITVYAPTVSKTANGKYDEIHDWEVFKSVNTASQNAFAGEKKNFTWTVRVDETTHGENYLVTGGITVVNPNPDDPMTLTLNDVFNDGSVATIGPCTGGTLDGKDLTVPAGGTAACDYSVTPKGDMAAFNAALPAQVTMSVQYPYEGGPSYFPVTTVSGDGALNGTYEGWCADIDHTISQNTNYTANVYSSYEGLPAGIIEKAYNLDLVNWIINQDYVGKPAGGSLGNYTYGDVQRAIWELIEDNGTSNTSGLGSWNQTRVNQIKAAATANGEGFVPTCGDFVAIILQPVGGEQLITIAQVTFASLGVNCATENAVTAVLNGIEFPASKLITWTPNPINPTATLDDDQKPDWPTTVSADTTFNYQDPQGYTCPTDPAVYTDGFYQYNESNTAVLTFSTGSDTATASTAVKCYLPLVDITKTTNGADGLDIPVGTSITWQYVVKNTGSIALTNVTVTDNKLASTAINCGGGTNVIANLAAGASATCTASGTATKGLYENIGTATGVATIGSTTRSVTDTDPSSYFGTAPALTLTKVATEANFNAAGVTLHYTLVATNDGNVTLTGVSISDARLGTLTCDPAQPATLAPTAKLTCTGTYLTTQADVDAGKVDNTANASGMFGTTPVAAEPANETVPAVQNPHISLTKATATTSFDHVGQVISYTMVATNDGNVTLHDVSINDTKLGALTCPQPATLAPTEKLTCTGSHTVTQADLDAGKYDNTATVTGKGPQDQPVSATASASVPADQKPSVSIVRKTNGADGLTILVGNPITWSYLVTNTGNVTLTNVTVTDNKLAATAIKCNGDTTNVIASLAPNVSVTCTATGTATKGLYENTGTVSAKPPVGSNVTATDPSSYTGADPQIAIVKTTNGSDGPTIITGTTVTWTYTVTNVGNVPLSNVTVTDNKTGVTPVYKSGDAKSDGILDLTETWIYEATGTAIVGSYSNIGTASGSYTDSESHSRTDAATDPSNYTGKVQVNVNKTVNNKPFSGPALTFELRQGAAPVDGQFGTVLETQQANVANNGQVTFNTLLAVGTYQLCEYVPEGYVPSYTWGVYGVDWFKPGYAPGQGGLDPNILVCVNFTVNTDGTINYQNEQQIVQPLGKINIDNQVGQMPRTIGYWKNHSSSKESNGGQEPVLDRMLYKATQAGQTIQIGALLLPGGSTPDNAGTSATYAVRLLNKSRIDNKKKMASDPCFNLAAQLVAYRLNQPFGAWQNSVAAAAADYAQAMLLEEGFNGITHAKLTAKAIANLNYLASVLDAYNNDTLAIMSLALPYPGVYK